MIARVASAQSHPADTLAAAVRRAGSPVCVGLDPVIERLPATMRGLSAADALERFCLGVIDAVAPLAAAVKFQSACFERHGPAAIAALARCCAHARRAGLVTVLDAKRGDIGISAAHYAAAAAEHFDADWSTASPYLGTEGFMPFAAPGRGVFVLVRTSNPSGDSVQSIALAGGGTLSDAIARQVADAGAALLGETGYSSIGAVVGATKSAEARRLRALMPRQWFLIPGYGAQGGTADDIRNSVDEQGLGALVTASRSVIFPTNPDDSHWPDSVAAAADRMSRELRTALSDAGECRQ